MGAFTAPVASALLFLAVSFSPDEASARKNQGRFLARGAHLVLDGRWRCVRPSMHRRCHVPASGAAIKDSATKLDLFSASADRSAVGRKFSTAMAWVSPCSIGIVTGFLIGKRVDWMQATWSIAVWCVYGGILIARVRHAVEGKWVATLSIVAFSLLLSTFWGIRFISDRPSF
jgi:hypothetical protein